MILQIVEAAAELRWPVGTVANYQQVVEKLAVVAVAACATEFAAELADLLAATAALE